MGIVKVRLILEVEDKGKWGFDDVLRTHDKENALFIIKELIKEDLYEFFSDADVKVKIVEDK